MTRVPGSSEAEYVEIRLIVFPTVALVRYKRERLKSASSIGPTWKTLDRNSQVLSM